MTTAVLGGVNNAVEAMDRFGGKEPRLFLWGMAETSNWLSHAGLISGAAGKSLDFAGDAFWTLDAARTAVKIKNDVTDLSSGVSFSKVRTLASDVANFVTQGANAVAFYVKAKVIDLGALSTQLDVAGNCCQIAHATNALVDHVLNIKNAHPTINLQSEYALSGHEVARIGFSSYLLFAGTLNPVVMQGLLTTMWGTLVWNYQAT